MSHDKKFDAMRAVGETDRPFEFREARDALVTSVNDWLGAIASMRDERGTMPDGTLIGLKPRVVQTALGRSALKFQTGVEEYSQGVSLEGDGTATAYRLQSIRSTDTGGTEIIEVTGSDPLTRQFQDGGYDYTGQSEVVASFSLTDREPDTPGQYFGYEVRGNGSVLRRFRNERGANATYPVRTVEDLAIAADALNQIQHQFVIPEE